VKEFLLVFLAGFCIFVNRALPDSLCVEMADKAHELVRVERELDAKRAWMETLDHREQDAFEELLDLEEKLELTRRLISGLASKETAVDRRLQSEAKSLEEIRLRLRYHREGFRSRLREIYKHGRLVPQAMIWGVASPVDLASRTKLTRRILEEDRNLAKGIERRKVNLEENSQSLGESVAELSWLAGIKSEEQRAYQGELRGNKERRAESVPGGITGERKAVEEHQIGKKALCSDHWGVGEKGGKCAPGPGWTSGR
jgi:septal ring factor EnvC (AmiA/AmiB activator)